MTCRQSRSPWHPEKIPNCSDYPQALKLRGDGRSAPFPCRRTMRAQLSSMRVRLRIGEFRDFHSPAPDSASENVGQASSLTVDEAHSPRVSGGSLQHKPADKMSAPHSQTASEVFETSAAATRRSFFKKPTKEVKSPVSRTRRRARSSRRRSALCPVRARAAHPRIRG